MSSTPSLNIDKASDGLVTRKMKDGSERTDTVCYTGVRTGDQLGLARCVATDSDGKYFISDLVRLHGAAKFYRDRARDGAHPDHEADPITDCVVMRSSELQDSDTQGVVGVVHCDALAGSKSEASFTMILDPEWTGLRIALTAAEYLFGLLKEDGWKRVEAGAAFDHDASLSVLKKLGFKEQYESEEYGYPLKILSLDLETWDATETKV